MLHVAMGMKLRGNLLNLLEIAQNNQQDHLIDIPANPLIYLQGLYLQVLGNGPHLLPGLFLVVHGQGGLAHLVMVLVVVAGQGVRLYVQQLLEEGWGIGHGGFGVGAGGLRDGLLD